MRFGSKQPKCFPIGYQGIMACDYRLDRRDGRCHLLDFNPSMGAQFRLLEGDNGMMLCAPFIWISQDDPYRPAIRSKGEPTWADQHFLRC